MSTDARDDVDVPADVPAGTSVDGDAGLAPEASAEDRPVEAELPVRRVAFEYPDDFDPMWAPQLPEFAAAANAISLGMPYAEPQFIRAVTSTFDRLDPHLRARTESYIQQETGHYTQHQRLNQIVTDRYPAMRRVERLLARNDAWVERRSPRFKVAYAASGETISFGVARWTEGRLGTLMDKADPLAATLFCWHLAEEIEHKSNTFDVFEATDGSRLRYAWTAIIGFLTIVTFTFVGALVQLHGEKRLRYPICWFRLLGLGLSMAFELLPTLVVSSLPGHHPTDLVDPIFLPAWLGQYDPVTGTMPLWGELPDGATTTPSAASPPR